jgi:carbon-monoxide dehydrogenase small subunit
MEGIFIINGSEKKLSFDSSDILLNVLRANGFTEVKSGCHEGQCGSCVILLDGELVNSCQIFAATAVGKDIVTIKGIGNIHSPHPIQEAFVETGAVQCGFCIPGMVLAAYYLLKSNPDPDDEEISKALDGNLCRCTGYVKIHEAVKLAARRMAENV